MGVVLHNHWIRYSDRATSTQDASIDAEPQVWLGQLREEHSPGSGIFRLVREPLWLSERRRPHCV